ncbi:hemerythrin domain-containing protein [Pseudonocardia endophytica]|uniref:Hemerythrin HHE cation binding domain-containing protein n=1 Tax=Pseudonocardia endophytica TaxID=401976 RepID=A0A4R1HFY5_PSEEN|nr:hemerythrin domain-containing protein [Pseudonocardia endophytica]TCK21064.1 hemerythrin HHE cation binding domain-containing protein [Pseudonocardia endophytica]
MTTADATRTADLTGIAIAHRMMRTDLHRLVPTAERIADGEACDRKRAAALATWVEKLCEEIHHHHTAEDDIAWPVIARHAGQAVDLSELSDDHAALDPLLDGLRTTAKALRGATDLGRADVALSLARRLAALRDEIDEHLDAEETDLFPIIERYVPAEEWDTVIAGVQKGGPGLRFMLPRVLAVVTDEEHAVLSKEGGPVLVALAWLLRPGHRRRERLVFG